MSEEREDIAAADGAPPRKVWSKPILTTFAADDAATNVNVDTDGGYFS